MRYKRYSITETLAAARVAAKKHDRPTFVYATAYGYTIEYSKPPASMSYYKVAPDGAHELIEPKFG